MTILDLQVAGEESAGGVRALGGDDIALSLAAVVIENAIGELLHGEVGVGLLAGTGGALCLNGTVVQVLLGEAGDGSLALLDVVGVGSCNDDLELAAVLALVGGGGRSEDVTPEGSLDYCGGIRVGAVRARILEYHN